MSPLSSSTGRNRSKLLLGYKSSTLGLSLGGGAASGDPIGKTQGNPAESAAEIMAADPTRSNGLQWIKPSGYGGAAFQVYCILNSEEQNSVTDPGGWMHIATVHDNLNISATAGGSISMWGYYIHRDTGGNYDKSNENGGRWGDTNYFGSQSFQDNFKHNPGYGNIPVTQMMVMDKGNNLRRLFYTETISQVASTRHWFCGSNPMTTNCWLQTTQAARNRSTSNRVDSGTGCGLRNLSVTRFNRNDDVFGNITRLLVMFGEYNGMDASNHDRSVMTPYDSGIGVSSTQGLGVSRQDSSSNAYRNVDPTFRDQPGGISDSYNYTLWVK